MTAFVEIYPEIADDWAMLPFTGFCLDSRHIQQGEIFVALKSEGAECDEVVLQSIKNYSQQALAKGAIAVITEVAGIELPQVYYIAQLKQKIGRFQKQFLQLQQAQVLARAVAVTGTNGKTTVSRLIAELLTLLQQKTAVMGTTGNGILPHLTPSTHTTLHALQFQQAHYHFSQQGAKFIALEASSHGLEQGRLAGTELDVAVFTNLSRDHLDYHGTFEAYAQAKARLFAFTGLQYAIIHADDEYAPYMIDTATQNPSIKQVICYSMQRTDVDYYVSDVMFDLQGARFTLHHQHETYAVQSCLLGKFNVANVLAAMIAVEKLGFALSEIVPLIPALKGASGRMQTVYDADRLFIVDYAHTPDALAQVLSSLQENVQKQLWVVFGCGGDRDRGKRPLMTQVAIDLADKVVLTTDNPRSESPIQIFEDMKYGINEGDQHLVQIEDRREAIRYVVQQAQAGDIVLIAGKGHENYQEIEGVRHWFDDVVEVQSAIDVKQTPMPPTYSV